jgi:hypothetical protein
MVLAAVFAGICGALPDDGQGAVILSSGGTNVEQGYRISAHDFWMLQRQPTPTFVVLVASDVYGMSGTSASPSGSSAAAAVCMCAGTYDQPPIVARTPGESPLSIPIPPPWSLLRPPRTMA